MKFGQHVEITDMFYEISKLKKRSWKVLYFIDEGLATVTTEREK